MRPTILEVDVRAFKHNVDKIQEYVRSNLIMPVIKANGYGTYINTRKEILDLFDIVAVAIVDEAIALRKIGYDKEIFVLNQPSVEEINDIAKYNVTVGVSERNFIKAIGESNKKINIHLEIDTGMGRTGIQPFETIEISKTLKSYSNINVEGIYTHFSSADFDEEFTKKQVDKFKNAINDVEGILGKLKYVHCSASNGILKVKDDFYNLVRPGIILYGYESFDKVKEILDLKPICKLKSKITFLKDVDENTPISYSQTYKTNKKTKVATIPIGYADGIRRLLSNKGNVVIRNKKAPIIGNVCMDSFMVDVTDIEDVKIGDEVYIWDNNIITLEEVAKQCNTINYEIISTISNRVPRVFKIENGGN